MAAPNAYQAMPATRWWAGTSGEMDVAVDDVDRGAGTVGACIWSADVHDAAGRHEDAVERLVIAGVVGGRTAAEDVDGVVEPGDEAGVIEVDLLDLAVRGEPRGVGDLQAPPLVPVLLPCPVLPGGEAGRRIDERGDEVVPVGVAGEVERLQGVPWRGSGQARERSERVEALLDDGAVGGDDRGALRGEHADLVGPGERGDRVAHLGDRTGE